MGLPISDYSNFEDEYTRARLSRARNSIMKEAAGRTCGGCVHANLRQGSGTCGHPKRFSIVGSGEGFALGVPRIYTERAVACVEHEAVE